MSDENRSAPSQPGRPTPAQLEQMKEQVTSATDDPVTKRLLAAGKDYPELPGVHVTVNQVVAYNMAYFRKVAGITQEELGRRLCGWTSKPWSKAAVSAAERSWDGKRVRQFDADLLYGLARALDVPISAFFLPPEKDGVNERYLIDPPHTYSEEDWGGRSEEEILEFTVSKTLCSHMRDLAMFALADPSDDNTPVMVAYRSRLSNVWAMYFGDEFPEDDLKTLTSEDQLVDRAARLRGHYAAIRELSGEIGIMLERTYDRLAEERRKKKASGAKPSDPS
ncbi:helix-turn-helix domain-containing protein [Actinomadura sp. NPDC049382]|uniref:helix-turn-helix domain-containing protein n=1 Tax=Actinomadura sp. NPDC049382 TaxID=3158220 RepID=UPI003441CE4B